MVSLDSGAARPDVAADARLVSGLCRQGELQLAAGRLAGLWSGPGQPISSHPDYAPRLLDVLLTVRPEAGRQGAAFWSHQDPVTQALGRLALAATDPPTQAPADQAPANQAPQAALALRQAGQFGAALQWAAIGTGEDGVRTMGDSGDLDVHGRLALARLWGVTQQLRLLGALVDDEQAGRWAEESTQDQARRPLHPDTTVNRLCALTELSAFLAERASTGAALSSAARLLRATAPFGVSGDSAENVGEWPEWTLLRHVRAELTCRDPAWARWPHEASGALRSGKLSSTAVMDYLGMTHALCGRIGGEVRAQAQRILGRAGDGGAVRWEAKDSAALLARAPAQGLVGLSRHELEQLFATLLGRTMSRLHGWD